MAASRRDDDLVGRVAVKRLWQAAALDKNRSRQFPDTQALWRHGLVEPLVHGTVENQLALFDLLRHLPDRDQRDEQIFAGEASPDRCRSGTRQPGVVSDPPDPGMGIKRGIGRYAAFPL